MRTVVAGFATGFVATCFLARARFRGDLFRSGLDSGGISQVGEIQFQKFLETAQVGCGVHISTEAEIDHPVVAEDGAVDGQFAADRDIGIPMQHLVSQDIERKLRPRHIRANHVERRERYLADHGAGEGLHRTGQDADQTASQTD